MSGALNSAKDVLQKYKIYFIVGGSIAVVLCLGIFLYIQRRRKMDDEESLIKELGKRMTVTIQKFRQTKAEPPKVYKMDSDPSFWPAPQYPVPVAIIPTYDRPTNSFPRNVAGPQIPRRELPTSRVGNQSKKLQTDSKQRPRRQQPTQVGIHPN
jgi:hypothetical protein